MIRLPKLIQYFKQQISNSEGAIKSIFLSNGENDIIATTGGGYEDASVLSTLLNDSLYIIRLNLHEGEQPRKNEQPLEISLCLGDKHAFLFSIKNLMIMGVVVEQKLRGIGHKMANDMLKFVTQELENVVEWTQNNDVY